jgi:hypothetical protein
MAETKQFDTCDVLSTITGRLIGKIDGVYQVLNWMTGESVFTHQLPRISREARPVVIAAHPLLQQAVDEADQVNRDNWQEWRRTWEDRYGLTIAVPKFNADSHERIDPMSEAAEMMHPDKIISVAVPKS